jgi:RecA/RadA recombinase
MKEKMAKKDKASKPKVKAKTASKAEKEIKIDKKPKAKDAAADLMEATSSQFDSLLDKIEVDYNLTSQSVDQQQRQSTGMLLYDTMLGGGLCPGWYTNVGMEQCAKTTTLIVMLAEMLKSNVKVKVLWDAEGSTSAAPDYVANILETNGVKLDVEQVFGVRDAKGAWAVRPQIRCYTSSIGEDFFDFVAKLSRVLPDKIMMGGKWYEIYDDIKDAKGKIKQSAQQRATGLDYDKAFYKKSGKCRVEVADGSLQAFILLDSYQSLVPESQDVDDPNNTVAIQASMYSKGLMRVKGKLAKKRICVFGVNTFRAVPMAMYGPPLEEKCGNALKIYSDVRQKLQSVRPPHGGKDMLEEEPSVAGEGVDTYRYVKISQIKNKLSAPHQVGYFRIWVSDFEGNARGICPVQDTYMYMVNTGLIEASEEPTATQRNKIKFRGPLECKPVLGWLDFKTLILGTKTEQADIYKKLKLKPRNLRKWCFKQLQGPNGLDNYFETKRTRKLLKASKVKADKTEE